MSRWPFSEEHELLRKEIRNFVESELAPLADGEEEAPAVIRIDTDLVLRQLGKVVAALPGGGEARPGQQEMALAVASAIESNRHLIVQAGTGTGKSVGYLVPALLSGRSVSVITRPARESIA